MIFVGNLTKTRVNNLLVNIDTDYEFLKQMRSFNTSRYESKL